MTTTTQSPIRDFIDAAAKISGIKASIILHPTANHMQTLGKEQYYLACRLRWLSAIHGKEQGMKRMEIVKATGWSENITYTAEYNLRQMKLNKPLCRMLRDIMNELTN